MKQSVVVAFAGNPNVGKSTLFNSLTGMRQHTGNWPGKTVEKAEADIETDRYCYHLIDLPFKSPLFGGDNHTRLFK